MGNKYHYYYLDDKVYREELTFNDFEPQHKSLKAFANLMAFFSFCFTYFSSCFSAIYTALLLIVCAYCYFLFLFI